MKVLLFHALQETVGGTGGPYIDPDVFSDILIFNPEPPQQNQHHIQ